MANIDGGAIDGTIENLKSSVRYHDRIGTTLDGNLGAPPKKFLMRGRDLDCVGVVYREWLVTGSPDFAGAQYVGARCGVTPLADVSSTPIDT